MYRNNNELSNLNNDNIMQITYDGRQSGRLPAVVLCI